MRLIWDLEFGGRCQVDLWIVRFFLERDWSEGADIRFVLFVGVESAAFPGQGQEEIDRLLHMVYLSPP